MFLLAGKREFDLSEHRNFQPLREIPVHLIYKLSGGIIVQQLYPGNFFSGFNSQGKGMSKLQARLGVIPLRELHQVAGAQECPFKNLHHIQVREERSFPHLDK